MTEAPRVLLITRSDDNDSVRLVADALRERGAVPLRLDTDLYPQQVQISTEYGRGAPRRCLHTNGETHRIDDLTAAWYRRFLAGGRLPVELGDEREVCVHESRRTLYGTIAALGCFELDPWICVRKCDHKELQLRRASELGLDIPPTLFSNEPAAVKAFFEAFEGDVVTKMQSSFAIYRNRQEQVVFTSRVPDLEGLEGLRWSPMMFQPRLPKRYDIRATVVGKRVFTAAVDSQKSKRTATDWREDGLGLLDQWFSWELPPAVQQSLLALVADFGLNYAAADFVLTLDGRHVFLEINAGGEWFWLQRHPGLPIAEALADTLLGIT